ncbi:MAG TPA: hypothetical protein VFR97_09750 [Capillimicrobium sp.]|nr:hypothetical protein [Capillimicrobium sp.]
MPAPPAPWHTRAQAVVWWHRAASDAPKPDGARATLPVTIAGFVRYLENPVGPYDEIVASPVLRLDPRPAAWIPFIAVDSADSVEGGRANWDLPKTLGSFDLRPPVLSGRGPDWSVEARVRARPRRVPVALAALVVQPRAELRVRVRGRARLATVEVTRSDPAWLREGRHPGVVLDDARADFL